MNLQRDFGKPDLMFSLFETTPDMSYLEDFDFPVSKEADFETKSEKSNGENISENPDMEEINT